MKLTWIGHSCFKIEKAGYGIIIDPYQDGSVPGLLPVAESANQVLCSHEHGDHCGRDAVKLVNESAECPFQIEVLQTYHDEVKGAKRGNNQIFLLNDGEKRIAHLGDLGCRPTEEQMEKLRGLDVILIPVGGYYTIDGKQAAELISELKPKITIPMHFRDDTLGYGFAEIEKVGFFTDYMDSVMTFEGSGLDLDQEVQAQVVVLQPARRVNG